MKKANVICATLSLSLLSAADAADTEHSNISLRIPERLYAAPVSVVELTAVSGGGHSIKANFCVTGSDGLQFSIASDDLELSTALEFVASEKTKDQTQTLHGSVKECQEQDFGILKITRLPQGRQSVTAVVIVE